MWDAGLRQKFFEKATKCQLLTTWIPNRGCVLTCFRLRSRLQYILLISSRSTGPTKPSAFQNAALDSKDGGGHGYVMGAYSGKKY